MPAECNRRCVEARGHPDRLPPRRDSVAAEKATVPPSSPVTLPQWAESALKETRRFHRRWRNLPM